MELQAIFEQADQCLVIDDPLKIVLDRIHDGVTQTGASAYLLSKLPLAIAGATPPYAISNLTIDHFPADIPIPTGPWRSMAHSYNCFFIECFVDELAHKAGVEPLSYRMQMLVGQTLALCYLDPATLEQSGAVPREVLLQRLVGLIGQESLVRTLNPRRKRLLERVSEETVRKQVGEAVRRLADLGFVDMLEESHLRLRPALLRFADPVRDQQDPSGALERLVAEGEIVLAEPAEEEDATSDDEESVE